MVAHGGGTGGRGREETGAPKLKGAERQKLILLPEPEERKSILRGA